jgi:hypothetical protein
MLTNLLCTETILPEYCVVKPSNDEILKLKSLHVLRKHDVDGPVPLRQLHVVSIVAGGYAAWVDGRTNFYDDIDIFTTDRIWHMRRSEQPYNGIFDISESGSYQFIRTINEHHGIVNYAKEILKGFDLQDCCVAYGWCRQQKVYFKVTRRIDYTHQNILKLKASRMKKYNKRSTTVKPLKWLALTAVKEHVVKEDFADFIKDIDIAFYILCFNLNFLPQNQRKQQLLF